MVIMFSEGKVADYEIHLLARHLHLLDAELKSILFKINSTNDPDADGLCYAGESIIGNGLVIIQRYTTSVWAGLAMRKKDALAVGPLVRGGITIAEAVNAAANYWKHHEEWFPSGLKVKNSGHMEATRSTLEKVVPCSDYTCSNFLAALLDSDNIELCGLLPLIIQWRDSVIANTQNTSIITKC